MDTCGFVPKEAIDKVMPYTDTFLYDLKAMDEDVHIKCTGQSNARILENLQYIDSLGKKIEIRITYVPEYTAEEIPKLKEFISRLKHVTKVKILPYHNYGGSKYVALDMENTLPSVLPIEEELRQAIQMFGIYSEKTW